MSESGDSIIDLYKEALNSKNNNKEDLIKEVSNSIELFKNDVVPENTNSDDPLEKFLFKLTGILKENQKSEESSLIEEFTETVEKQDDIKIKETKEENDEDVFEDVVEENEQNNPLENFLFKLNDILVTKKNETVKNSALNLIEQLKNKEDEPKKIEIEQKPKEVSLPPQPELGQVPNVTPPLSPVKKTSKPLPKKKNEYVKELESADKDLPKIPKESDQQKTIKEEVQKQVKEFLGKYRNGVVAEGGGGDGNFSTEYKYGGTMNGSLNVTGQYLSGGVDLATIFSGGGGGSSDRLIAGLQQLILNSDGTLTFPDDTIRTSDGKLLSIEAETLALSAFTKIALSGNAFYAYDSNGNAITFDTTDNEIVLTTQGTNSWTFGDNGKLSGPNNILEINGNLNTSSKILSGGVDLANIFLTQETDSQTLNYVESSAELSISNGNTVSLSSIKNSSLTFVKNNFLPLSGGSVTGNLNTSNKILSGGVDLANIFLTQETDSQTLSFNNNTSYLSISNGNTVSLSGYVIPNIRSTAQNYLPLSGGTLNGNFDVYGNTYINNNLTIGGNLTALGTATFANTIFATTSALSVINTGPGPALYVFQSAGPYDVASFYDGDGIEVLHVGNANPNGLGKVGINESFPNVELTVRGSISATDAPTTRSNLGLGNTDNVQFNQINANVYLSGGQSLFNLLSSSGGGDPAVNTVVYTNSANWINTSTIVQNNSTSWFEPIRRFDYVTGISFDVSYSGIALYGTSETSFTWNIIRLTYNSNGTISNQASALNSWTGRLTATYI